MHNLKEFQKDITLYDERRSASGLLQHIVLKYRLKGKRIHDANIAAAMKIHGIKVLLTQNKDDFRCFEGLTAFNLSELADALNHASC